MTPLLVNWYSGSPSVQAPGIVESTAVITVGCPATGTCPPVKAFPARSIALIRGSVPLSVPVTFSSHLSAAADGQEVGGGGFESGTGVTWLVIRPVSSMSSSHQPSSCGVSLQPGPYS